MEETTATLGEVIVALQQLAAIFGDDALTCLDICIDIDNAPAVIGTVVLGDQESKYHLVKKERHPIFSTHGKRIVVERLLDFYTTSQQLMSGLDGNPFSWNSEKERMFGAWRAKRMGITLITPSFADEMNLQPKEGENPIGTGLFVWGRRKVLGSLYAMECQLERKPKSQED